MKKYILSMMAVALLACTSCTDRDSEGLTNVTTYAVITLNGESEMIVDKGSSFTDPGCTADLGGEDVTSKVQVSNPVDTNKSGVYTISYSFTNEDGFSSASERTVIVLNPNSKIEGFYTSDPASYRINASGTKTVYGGQYSILIIDNEDGSITIDDGLGGYYGQRAGYGSNYYMETILSYDPETGALDLLGSYVPGWGDSLVAFANGSFDAATGTMYYEATYVSSMVFYVTLHKD